MNIPDIARLYAGLLVREGHHYMQSGSIGAQVAADCMQKYGHTEEVYSSLDAQKQFREAVARPARNVFVGSVKRGALAELWADLRAKIATLRPLAYDPVSKNAARPPPPPLRATNVPAPLPHGRTRTRCSRTCFR